MLAKGRFRQGLEARKIPIATPDNNRSPIVSFHIRKRQAEAAKILEAERVKVSLQEVDAAPTTRVRVAMAFFNNDADIDRMLEVASKLATS